MFCGWFREQPKGTPPKYFIVFAYIYIFGGENSPEKLPKGKGYIRPPPPPPVRLVVAAKLPEGVPAQGDAAAGALAQLVPRATFRFCSGKPLLVFRLGRV